MRMSSIQRYPIVYGALAFVMVAAACGERPVRASSPAPAPLLEAEARLVLPIVAREHAPEAPPAGWCGETAIQEGLLHLGVWAPQRLINRVGRPVHPDLYSTDIPVALSELGVRFTFYAGARGFDAFARWIRAALDEGDPVIAGVKILPTLHPEWGLDHFVLVVGHGDKGLLVNTTWGHRLWVGDTVTPGLSFRNAFYAIRLGGVGGPRAARAARLTVIDEGAARVKVRVTCGGLVPGAAYRLEHRGGRPGEALVAWQDVTAVGEHVETEVSVDAAAVARFQCVRVE
jgi:hypothetical protein